MLYTTNIIKYPFTSVLNPKSSSFTMDFKQNQEYIWVYSNALNDDIYGNKLLTFDADNQKILFSGIIDNADKRLLKFNFDIIVKLSNSTKFKIASTNVSTSNKHLIINKKLKITDPLIKKFEFKPYLDRIYLSMIVNDNSKLNNSDVSLTFSNFGFDLVNVTKI